MQYVASQLGRQSVIDMNMFHENRGAKEAEE